MRNYFKGAVDVEKAILIGLSISLLKNHSFSSAKLTESPQFEQNFETISRLLCNPVADCEKIIKLSAYIRQLFSRALEKIS